MLINSLRTAIMLLSLLFMSGIAWSVLSLALMEHRQLYAGYAEGDLDALTDNLAADLVAVVNQPDEFFQLKTLMLKLDPYEHVKGAAVFNTNGQLIDFYIGSSQQHVSDEQRIQFHNWQLLQPGLHHKDGNLIAVKLIGDPAFPLGFLVVVNDFQGPLDASTNSLLSSTLPTALIAILILMMVFAFFGNRWLTPLTHLSTFARRVQRSRDYSLTIPVSGHYEVSELTQDINNMMDVIRRESEINLDYVNLLEKRREEMEYLANYDSLTGLMNRKFFIGMMDDLLRSAKDEGKQYDLMFVGLDGFKGVNDSFGHEIGDMLLAGVAGRLITQAPANALVSRHGGDEFLILLEGIEDKARLDALAGSMVSGLAQKFTISSWEVRITASIGIARHCENYGDVRELIRDADIAMFDAKRDGKSRFSFFEPQMMAHHQRRIDIANAISHALNDNEFSIHYQPKVAPDGTPLGAEALIRWHSSTLGFVSPAEFIPIAEQSGKVTNITQWVIQHVCEDIRDVFLPLGIDTPISINLSAADLKKYHLVGVIKGAFRKYQIPAGMIEFEVTEHSYLDNLEIANKFFAEITALGCPVALDDFGTGYSSLSYLTKIPIDVLKIDKQFVDNIGTSERDDALVLTIIEMAKRLGMVLCAEGVESEQQLTFLGHHGCQIIQGYYFAKPMICQEYIEFIQAHNASDCPQAAAEA